MRSFGSINDNIKNIRELKNYTQQYMAQSLGITQAGYCKIEKGKTEISYIKLRKIAAILEVSVEVIMNFDSQLYLKTFSNRPTESNPVSVGDLSNHYHDKIIILESLISKTDLELERYKKIFGTL